MMADMRLEREKDREIMLQQTQYMKSLGIKLEDVQDQNEELLDSNKGLKKEVRKVQHKLGVAVEDKLKTKGVSFDGNNIDLEDSQIAEEELIEEMKVINDSKRDI